MVGDGMLLVCLSTNESMGAENRTDNVEDIPARFVEGVADFVRCDNDRFSRGFRGDEVVSEDGCGSWG